MMARINALFESWIVACPEEWQCFQNRWPKSTRRQVLQARALAGACASDADTTMPMVEVRLESTGVRSTISQVS